VQQEGEGASVQEGEAQLGVEAVEAKEMHTALSETGLPYCLRVQRA